MRVALIGCSGIAGSHISGWKVLPDVEMAYLCDVNEEAAEQVKAETFPSATVLTDCRELLDRDDYDAVDICTPTKFHAEYSIAFHQAGKHVLVEKPMCMDMVEADRMKAEIAEDGPAFMIEHRWLFESHYLSLVPYLEPLGPLHWIRMRLGHKLPLSPPIKATGCLLDMGYHLVYTALHLMGPATGVYARATAHVLDDAKNDSGLYVLSHKSGTSVLEASFSSFGPTGLYRGLELYGHDGSAMVVAAPEKALWVTKDEKTREQADFTVTTPWGQNVIRYYTEVIEGASPVIAGIREGYAAMEVIDRALKSVEDGATH